MTIQGRNIACIATKFKQMSNYKTSIMKVVKHALLIKINDSNLISALWPQYEIK